MQKIKFPHLVAWIPATLFFTHHSATAATAPFIFKPDFVEPIYPGLKPFAVIVGTNSQEAIGNRQAGVRWMTQCRSGAPDWRQFLVALN